MTVIPRSIGGGIETILRLTLMVSMINWITCENDKNSGPPTSYVSLRVAGLSKDHTIAVTKSSTHIGCTKVCPLPGIGMMTGSDDSNTANPDVKPSPCP
ncbi:MAG: hypothetical protein GYA34_11340 [Chloroflexi bacterium]|nr:hypothetical protein [Chloroflexota bacterium]